jgi:hypothetical protein
MEITRVGVVEGKRANYSLRVDGQTVGRIERRRQVNPMIGGPKAYTFIYHAKRGPYDTGLGCPTQAEAEAFLLAARAEAR